MLPIVALVLAVAVVLVSALTIAWLYLRLVRQMYREDHKGSYEPAKTEEKVLGKSLSLLNGKAKTPASDETDNKGRRRSGRTVGLQRHTLVSHTPREPEDGIALDGSFAELDQPRTDQSRSPDNRPMTSTPADGASLCHSRVPQVHTAYAGRSLRYAPMSAMEADHIQIAASEASMTSNQNELMTRMIETVGNGSACTPTTITRLEGASEIGEDVFTADVDPHTGSECSMPFCEDQEEEEDSDGHSSTSGVHRVLRKTERPYSCYPFVEHCPRQEQGPTCIQFVPADCTLAHRTTAASTGSLPISEEDEADQAFFGKAQHDETYRQYLESIILKRKARMYYGPYGHIPRS
ncbi:hypothetical protein MRX96_020210 [Rhipicephalus microplus]